MTDTTTRPLPVDRATLDAYWLPTEPDSEVSRLTAVHAELTARLARIDATLADINTADVNAIADSDDVDQALADLDAATITVTVTLLRRQADVLAAATNLVRARIDNATRSDPAYTAWRGRCQQVVTDWLDTRRFPFDGPTRRAGSRTPPPRTARPTPHLSRTRKGDASASPVPCSMVTGSRTASSPLPSDSGLPRSCAHGAPIRHGSPSPATPPLRVGEHRPRRRDPRKSGHAECEPRNERGWGATAGRHRPSPSTRP
jgi:hypothetical protein